MNKPIQDPRDSISRRGFVAARRADLRVRAQRRMLGRLSEALAAEGAKLNAWVTIGADDTITILCPTSEMGQGVLTALPLILAEELDADWSKVKCEFAPGNPKVYGGSPHKMFKGAQVTLASVSVPGYFMPLRMAGAQARKVLIDAVAAEVEGAGRGADDRQGARSHATKVAAQISYGEVAKFAKVPAEPAEDRRGRSQEAGRSTG